MGETPGIDALVGSLADMLLCFKSAQADGKIDVKDLPLGQKVIQDVFDAVGQLDKVRGEIASANLLTYMHIAQKALELLKVLA